MKAILIGGSSHVGKTTVAKSLATRLGWTHISTDSLARHPGRPWRPAPRKVPDHVAQHYLTLSVDELIQDVLHHYKTNVWPKVESIITSQINDPSSTEHGTSRTTTGSSLDEPSLKVRAAARQA